MRKSIESPKVGSHRPLLVGKSTPKSKYNAFLVFVQKVKNSVGEGEPTKRLVGVRLVSLDCHGGVEHQNSLFGPGDQVSVRWTGPALLLQVRFQLGVHVSQGRGNLVAQSNRKAETMSLIVIVVGV